MIGCEGEVRVMGRRGDTKGGRVSDGKCKRKGETRRNDRGKRKSQGGIRVKGKGLLKERKGEQRQVQMKGWSGREKRGRPVCNKGEG